MTLLDERAAQVEPADLLIMAMVESVHASNRQCVPASIHVLIGGLPVAEAAKRLHRLSQLGLLDEELSGGLGLYWVSPWEQSYWTGRCPAGRRRCASKNAETSNCAQP
jgi:hypothetical protein